MRGGEEKSEGVMRKRKKNRGRSRENGGKGKTGTSIFQLSNSSGGLTMADAPDGGFLAAASLLVMA